MTAAGELTMNDLFNLYKPGQLSDLMSMLQKSLAQLTSAVFSTATQADVRSLGTDIATLQKNALAPGVIEPKGPNAALITTTLAKYKVIPTSISGYAQQPVVTDTTQLAKDNAVFGPIVTYLDMTLTDFCNNVIYAAIQDNLTVTDAAKINAIKSLILSYVTFLNNVPTKLLFPGTILNPNFGEIASRLSKVLTAKMGVVIIPPGSMTYQNINVICSGAGANPDTTQRKTSGTVIVEVAVSVRLSLTAIASANAFDKYNTPKNIALLKQIPELLQKLVSLSTDPVCVQYLTNFSATVIPIAEPTNSLFGSLTSSNFSATLSQKTTGIMNYIITQLLSQLPNSLSIFMGWLGTRITGRSFATMDQIYQLTAKVVLVLKAYVDILNLIINVFQVSIQNDAPAVRIVNTFNNLTQKNGFKVNLVPAAQGGKRYRHKRSRKHRRRRAPSKRRGTRSK